MFSSDLHVYPVSNYTFGSKTAKPEKDRNPAEMFARMQAGCDPQADERPAACERGPALPACLWEARSERQHSVILAGMSKRVYARRYTPCSSSTRTTTRTYSCYRRARPPCVSR